MDGTFTRLLFMWLQRAQLGAETCAMMELMDSEAEEYHFFFCLNAYQYENTLNAPDDNVGPSECLQQASLCACLIYKHEICKLIKPPRLTSWALLHTNDAWKQINLQVRHMTKTHDCCIYQTYNMQRIYCWQRMKLQKYVGWVTNFKSPWRLVKSHAKYHSAINEMFRAFNVSMCFSV